MAIIKNLPTIHTSEGVDKRKPSYSVGGNVNWHSHCGEQYRGSLKKGTITRATMTQQSHAWACLQREQ